MEVVVLICLFVLNDALIQVNHTIKKSFGEVKSESMSNKNKSLLLLQHFLL